MLSPVCAFKHVCICECVDSAVTTLTSYLTVRINSFSRLSVYEDHAVQACLSEVYPFDIFKRDMTEI